MRSAAGRAAGAGPAKGAPPWDTETWPGFGPAQKAPTKDCFDVPIKGRTLLDIEKEVAARMLEAHGGDRGLTAARLEIEPERLADLLGPPPGGPVLPWDPPPLHEVLAWVEGRGHV